MAEEQKPMAEGKEGEAAAAPAKKKGKLPVIVLLAAMLAAGGFFGVKLKQPKGPVKEPEVKLGAVLPLKEFLVNLDQGKYLRVEMELHLKEGAELKAGGEGGEGEGGGGPEMSTIRDTIIDVLNSKSASEIQSPSGKDKLRRQLAAAVNRALEELEKGLKGSEAEKKEESKEGDKKEGERKHPDWDSDTGPVLKIYFTNFATQ